MESKGTRGGSDPVLFGGSVISGKGQSDGSVGADHGFGDRELVLTLGDGGCAIDEVGVGKLDCDGLDRLGLAEEIVGEVRLELGDEVIQARIGSGGGTLDLGSRRDGRGRRRGKEEVIGEEENQGDQDLRDKDARFWGG